MDDQTKELIVRRALVPRRALLQGFVVLGLSILLTGILVTHASGQPGDFEHENVSLEGTHTDMQFFAGQSVRISANVFDYAAIIYSFSLCGFIYCVHCAHGIRSAGTEMGR